MMSFGGTLQFLKGDCGHPTEPRGDDALYSEFKYIVT